jgi:hypothetical protein
MAALGSKMAESLADLTDLPRDQIDFEPSGSANRIQADYEIWQQMVHKHC